MWAVFILGASESAAQTATVLDPSPDTPSPFNIAPPSRPERPYRGIFGAPRANRAPALTLEGSVGGGLSGSPVQNQVSGGGAGTGGGAQGGDGATTASATLTYSWRRDRIGISADNAVYTDYYPDLSDNSFLARDFATLTVHFTPTQSTRVSITEGFKNLPEFALSDLFDGEVNQTIPLNQDFGVTVERYTRFGTNVEITQRLNRRMTAAASMNYGHGKVSQGKEWTLVNFSGDLTYSIGRSLGVYGGYMDGGQRDEGPAVLREHWERRPRINFGVSFNKPLSISRRTRLDFGTGTAGVRDRVEQRTDYQLVGSAGLTHEFGRTWNAQLGYSRQVRYIEQISEPVLAHSLSGAVSGSLSRRMELKTGLSASTGQLGTGSGNAFDTYYGSAQLSVGINRYLGFGADYGYSKLATRDLTLLSNPFMRLSQHSARAYVKVWAGLLDRPQRP
jgi:hypothetical protein